MAGLTENKTKPSSWGLAELGKNYQDQNLTVVVKINNLSGAIQIYQEMIYDALVKATGPPSKQAG